MAIFVFVSINPLKQVVLLILFKLSSFSFSQTIGIFFGFKEGLEPKLLVLLFGHRN
jgi:hypothetical protein